MRRSTLPDHPREDASHGGDLGAHRARFPDAPEPLLDLSTGINPFAWPHPGGLPRVPAGALSRLPEPGALAELERLAGAAYGIPGDATVAACPGTGIGLAMLAQLGAGGAGAASVAIVSPTYSGAARAYAAAGTAVIEAGSLAEAEAMGTASVHLCRPNNPDGRIAPADEVLAAAARLAARGGTLVVDEAFADFEPCGGELAGRLPHPGLVLLRSFGKTYGLPGLRLGFVAGPALVVARLRDALGAWPVSGAAISIARAALADPAWRERVAPMLEERGGELDALLASSGFAAAGGTVLFRSVVHPRAAAIEARLGRMGILVRGFGRASPRLRFAIPADAAALERLQRGLDGLRPEMRT